MQDGAMPATPNWDIIRELYNKGLPLRQIAERFGIAVGTIAARASRGNWKRVATEASAIAHNVTITTQGKAEETPESSQLTKASAQARSKLSDALLEATGCLSLPKSKSLKSYSGHAALLQTLSSVAKTVYGWSEGQSQPAVRINLLGTAIISQAPSPTQVIDVTSTPVLPQQIE